jgi:DNA-binding ferritin-like protein
MNIAYDVARHKKLEKKYDGKYKEEMERKLGKEATKAIAEMNRRLEEMKAKDVRRVANELTDEETDDIRSMLLQVIPRFRWRIRKELAMRRI